MAREKDSISNTIFWISIRTFINIILLFVLVQGFVTAYHFAYRLFADIPYKAASSEVVEVTIVPGSDVGDVATVLEQSQIIDEKYLFMARAYVGQYNKRIMAGTYSLSPGMSPDEICKKICGIQSEDAS